MNLGFSPGDGDHDEPYVYVGPHDVTSLDRDDPYWNAPFGAVLPRHEVTGAPDALAFIRERCRTSHLTYSDIGI